MTFQKSKVFLKIENSDSSVAFYPATSANIYIPAAGAGDLKSVPSVTFLF